MAPTTTGLAGVLADELRRALNAPLREHKPGNIGWWVCDEHFRRLEQYRLAEYERERDGQSGTGGAERR
jgi:hypothetical protein